MPLYMTAAVRDPSEFSFGTIILWILWFWTINRMEKMVSRSRNSIRCVLHHGSRTMTPWFFLENPTEKKIQKMRYLDHFFRHGTTLERWTRRHQWKPRAVQKKKFGTANMSIFCHIMSIFCHIDVNNRIYRSSPQTPERRNNQHRDRWYHVCRIPQKSL